jgi:hypothetical protein
MTFLLQAEKVAFEEAEKKRLEEVCKHLLLNIRLALCDLRVIQY